MPDENNKPTQQEIDDQRTVESIASRMHVKIYAPFKTYFDGDAHSVSATNDTGPFDILPKHHNFMTLLNTGDIVVRTDRGEERIEITRGIMHVKANDVIVFLDV